MDQDKKIDPEPIVKAIGEKQGDKNRKLNLNGRGYAK